MNNKIGRNQLCPCGSGIKHKKCCLRREQIQIQHQQEFRRALDDYKKKSETEKGEKEIPQESNQEL